MRSMGGLCLCGHSSNDAEREELVSLADGVSTTWGEGLPFRGGERSKDRLRYAMWG